MNLYFCPKIDEENCWNLKAWKEFMLEKELDELELYLAKPERDTGMFYCTEFSEIGETGTCGDLCDGYSPRNGRSGICRYHRIPKAPTEKSITLKYNKENGKYHTVRRLHQEA